MMEQIKTQEAMHARERAMEKEATDNEKEDNRNAMMEQFKAKDAQHAKERLEESERRGRENEQVI